MRWILAALVIAVCVALSVVWQQSQQIANLRQKLEAQTTAADQLETKLTTALRSKLPAASEAASQTRHAIDADESARKRAAQDREIASIQERLMRDPTYAAWERVQARGNILRSFGDWLPFLHLPPDQLSRLKNLLVEKSLRMMDARSISASAGFSQEAIKAAVADAESNANLEIKTLLGSENATRFEQLQGATAYRENVKTLGALLADQGTPLTMEQEIGLAEAYFQGFGETVPLPFGATLSREEKRRAVFYKQAATVLSAEQLEFVKNHTEQGKQAEDTFYRVTGDMPPTSKQ
jgi:hypothetical protein